MACRGRQRWPTGSMPTRRARAGAGPPSQGAGEARSLFSGRDTEKTYWSVVEGSPPADEGAFRHAAAKVNTRSGWSVKVSDKGQPSVTRYR